MPFFQPLGRRLPALSSFTPKAGQAAIEPFLYFRPPKPACGALLFNFIPSHFSKLNISTLQPACGGSSIFQCPVAFIL
jgi:hypothetical protein